MNERINGWKDKCVKGWMNERMNERMNEEMKGLMKECWNIN